MVKEIQVTGHELSILSFSTRLLVSGKNIFINRENQMFDNRKLNTNADYRY